MSFLTAQRGNLLSSMRGALVFTMLVSVGATGSFEQSKASSSVLSAPVYVSDFELHSVSATPKAGALPHTGTEKAKQQPQAPLVYEDIDLPSVQARRLTDFFTVSLLQALSKKGFPAGHWDGRKAGAGALIRGVFAEPDSRNRIRRALLGGGSPNARFFLYVGIFNLGRQEQPLYELAPTQSPNDRYGPVITLNAYIPLAKYELDKNPSEEDVKRICEEIAASLVTLLEKNPNAFAP